MTWYTRLLNLARPARLARDIEREMAFHLAERADELRVQGMSATEAEREARRRFGNRTALRERTHGQDVVVWLESVLADLRYALRALRWSPGFATVAILSLGLGIGATTAMFTLINAVILRSLPVSHPEELVQVTMGQERDVFTNPLWEAIRSRADVALSGALAWSTQQFDLATGGEARRVPGYLVSGDFFTVLGVAPAAGRLLERSDDVRGCPPVAVLSNGLWRREYGGESSAIGRSISLDGHRFQIVGVADPRFTGVDVGQSVQVYAPLCAEEILEPGRAVLDQRSRWFLSIIGRPLPGLSAALAGVRLGSIAPAVFATTVPQDWDPQDQEQYQKYTLAGRAAPNGLSFLRAQYRGALFVLMAVVGVVLLIACGNVANLLLARAAGRRHEMAVRRAIGSGRGRLIRQLVTESLLLSCLGAALGVAFARWASRLVVALLASSGDTVFLDLSLDWRVLGFTVGVATVTGLVFGLAPAWRVTRIPPQAAMRAAGRNVADGHARFAAGKGLVIGQLALSLALVMAAGLLVGSLARLLWLDPGFRREGVLLVRANLANGGYQQPAMRSVEHDLLERLRSLPGVRTASSSMVTPIGRSRWNSLVHVDGYHPPERDDALVFMNTVSDGYFATLGTTLLAGRDFDTRDAEGSAPVAIINETMARRFFGDSRPLGKRFSVDQPGGESPSYQVVGIVQDSKYGRLTEKPLALAYYPHSQGELWGPSVNFELRTDGSPTALVSPVKAAMAEANRAIAFDFQTLADQVSQSLARPRLLAALSGFFGAMALLLAMIGLYGTVSYSVASRRSEIGVRLALGAAPERVLKMVLGEIGWLVGPGLVLGLLAALAGARVLGTFLFGVTASDPTTLTVSALALSAAAFVAGVVPAWRAARLDPVATLREE